MRDFLHKVAGMRTGLSGRSVGQAPRGAGAVTRRYMSSTASNLLLASSCSPPTRFYVAAEFALVKSRGFRIDGAGRGGPVRRAPAARHAGQRRGLSRLLPARHHHGLARPRLGRRADRRRAARTAADAARHAGRGPALRPSFLVGFLVFSSLHIVLGEQVPKTLAIREPEPVSLWIAYPLHVCPI